MGYQSFSFVYGITNWRGEQDSCTLNTYIEQKFQELLLVIERGKGTAFSEISLYYKMVKICPPLQLLALNLFFIIIQDW